MMLRFLIGLVLVCLTFVAHAFAGVDDNATAEEVRAHPDFVSSNYSLSSAMNSGDEDAMRVYEWIGYIPVGEERIYYTSFGEPLTCVKWEKTGEWVPSWVVNALDRLVKEELLVIDDLEPAKDFSYTTLDNKEKRLSEHEDEIIIVNFWAAWGPPCRNEMPMFDEVYREYGDSYTMLSVTVDNKQNPEDFFRDNNLSFDFGFDIDGAETYAIQGIPYTLFINPAGRVVSDVVGGMHRETFEEHLSKLIY